MTLQDCKNEIAKKNKFGDWTELWMGSTYEVINGHYWPLVCDLYGSECVKEVETERDKLKSENERLASGLNKAIEDLANTVPMDTYKHLWNSFTSSQSEVSLLKEQNNRLDDQVNELIGEKHAANELQSEITRLKDWQESAIKVLNDWYKVSDWLSDNGKAGLGDQYTAKALETLISQQAEIDSLKEQLNNLHKSISRI